MKLHFGCEEEVAQNILCEKTSVASEQTQRSILINGSSRWPRDADIPYIECPMGHFTYQFLACDVRTACWVSHDSLLCESFQKPLPPSFTCSNQIERVPYTLVCDHRADCLDGSDEDFCSHFPCRTGQFTCDNKQCILSTKLCDGWGDCQNGEDEEQCRTVYWTIKTIPPPALITLPDEGLLVPKHLDATRFTQHLEICPHSHFQCLDNGYCLPVFLRCNGVYDCPGREDETHCDSCPGFYRCRASSICIQHAQLCDGHAHCPRHDDELMCASICPQNCLCWGLAFFCSKTFTASDFQFLRYLDASGSRMTPVLLKDNLMLVFLSLAKCSLAQLDGLSFPNLQTFDLRDNQLEVISGIHLAGMPWLRELSVAGNPLQVLFEDGEGSHSADRILRLDLSRVVLHVLNVSILSAFPDLHVLNLSHSGLQNIHGEGFSSVVHLRVIDMRGCPLTWFPPGIFRGLHNLQIIHAHNFKVCCPAVLPRKFNVRNCFAPWSEISSCDDLMGRIEYSICAFTLSVIALVGNAVSFVFRTYGSKRENKLGYGTFVTHLSVSDFFMGVYLAIIGVADHVYRGSYLWNDETWRHSVTCTFAGFLSLLSSEVSALAMCLITIDRFLVLRFPFSRVHFSPRSAHVASLLVWTGGVLLVSVPLLPATSHWEFYSQNAICIPLPITRKDFLGHDYSFSILIIFNFIVFVFISMGQLSIYWSVRANSMRVSNTTKKTKDLTIARRLITVAMTDFMCWFPIGVLGLMASSGIPIPSGVNIAVAIFVLPLNSAVNPCLYTFNVIMERRRLSREEKLRAFILAQLSTGK